MADRGDPVLVLRPGALGDTLLAVPALRALRKRFPAHPLILAGQRGAVDLLERCGETDRGLAFDDPRIGTLLMGGGSWPFGTPERIVAWLSDTDGAMRRSLDQTGATDVLIAPSRPGDETTHCAVHLLRSLSPWGVSDRMDVSPLKLEAPQSCAMVIHPGSGAARKNWPVERFAAVARRLMAASVPLVLVVGEADTGAARALDAQLGRPLPRWESLTVPELASRLAGCRAYLGNDSGVSHLAGLAGARTLVLFGPTPPTVWQPLGPSVQVLPFETEPGAVARALLNGK